MLKDAIGLAISAITLLGIIAVVLLLVAGLVSTRQRLLAIPFYVLVPLAAFVVCLILGAFCCGLGLVRRYVRRPRMEKGPDARGP